MGPAARGPLTLTRSAIFGALARALAVSSCLGAVTLGCVPGLAGWDVDALEAEYPQLDAWGGHRLGDATPYFSPLRDGLVLFLCRWPRDRDIPVSLPPDATEEELQSARSALAAWQGADLGLRFVEAPPERARLSIRFVGKDRPPRRFGGSGATSADCELPAEMAEPAPGAAMPVALVRADIELQRNNIDLLGRAVPLTQSELAGAILHELGHALGYPGHAAAGSSVMVRSVERVRKLAEPVMADGGDDFDAPTVGALYAVPNGVVVGRLAVSGERMASVLLLARMAREEGWGRPFARVGDRSAKLWWVDREGRVAGFWVPDLERGWKSDLLWVPTSAAREHLSTSRSSVSPEP